MNFDQAFERLIGHEGGYTEGKDDPGGETKFGVSKRAYPLENIKGMTLERAKVLKLAMLWWVRNPFHNLFFYVMGVADRPRTFYSSREWGEPGWTFHYIKCGRLYLPFVSFKGWCNFYAGWRPYGAFGLKFNFAKEKPKG